MTYDECTPESRGILMDTVGSKQSTRLHFIDAAKAFAIYLVIVYHIGQSQPGLAVASSSQFLYFCHGIATIAVPLFFTINGYLVLNRQIDLRKNLAKTFRLYLVTLIWSFIIIASLSAIDDEHYSWAAFLKAVFLLKHGDNNHLWFLFALTSIYLLVPAIKSIYDYRDQNVILWTLLVLFGFCFANIAVNWCFIMLQAVRGQPLDVVNGAIKIYRPFDIQGINPFGGYSWAFVYFILGGLLERHMKNERRPIPLWGLALIFLVAALTLFGFGSVVSQYLHGKQFDTVFDGYNSIPGMAMTFSLLLIFHRLWTARMPGASLTASIGANTLGIYLLHIPILRLLNHLYFSWTISHFVPMNLVYGAAILVSSWLLTLLFKRTPVFRLLFEL